MEANVDLKWKKSANYGISEMFFLSLKFFHYDYGFIRKFL